jgi:hypothetical protein
MSSRIIILKHPTAPTMSIQDYGTGTLAVSQLEHNLLQQEKIFSERTGEEFKFKVVYMWTTSTS